MLVVEKIVWKNNIHVDLMKPLDSHIIGCHVKGLILIYKNTIFHMNKLVYSGLIVEIASWTYLLKYIFLKFSL